LIISNLYFIKETVVLNEQLSIIYELEDTVNNLKAEHQKEIEKINSEHEAQIELITSEYDEKVNVVNKALNALEYEIEEFYKNKFILKEDYLENLKKINEAKEKLEDD
ncbi:MAG TPA: Gam protein, partial [Thermoclostridium sp.]|nr:Gam protein [Thermoclostridium sp.]